MATSQKCIPAGAEDDSDELAENVVSKLKITVVGDKSKGAGLNGKDFDKTLSFEINELMENIITNFRTHHNHPATKLALKDILSQNPLPHRLALKLYLKCPQTNKSSLADCVLNAIKMLANEKPNILETIDDDTRMVAFNLFKSSELKFIDTVCDVYDLRHIGKLLEPKVKDLINNGYYEAAAKWAINLGLAEVFEIPELVFPLVLLKSVTILLKYLHQAPNLQQPTLEFLDQLLDRYMTPYQKCHYLFEKYNYKNLPSTMLESTKALRKFMALLCKHLKFQSWKLPNHTFLHTLSSFRHFFNDYIGGDISVEAFKELLDAKADTKTLQLAFIEDIKCSHPSEAIFWLHHFNIPSDDWPKGMNTEGKYLHRNKYRYVPRDRFLKLGIRYENIKFVNNEKAFIDMLTDLECQSIVAFDSEWDPIWTLSDEVTVALFQLATAKNVYLVDCLIKDFHTKMWHEFERRILNNPNVLKIGYDIQHDISALSSSLPLKFKVRHKHSFLDMKQFNAYLKCLKIVYPYENNNLKFGGLSRLVFECLGKPLDKSNKISKWTRRPLRHDQVMYASVDAYCLIQIYYVIDNLLKRENIDINLLIDFMHNGKIAYEILHRHNLNQQKVWLQPQLHPELQSHLQPQIQNQYHHYHQNPKNGNGSNRRRQRVNKNMRIQSQ